MYRCLGEDVLTPLVTLPSGFTNVVDELFHGSGNGGLSEGCTQLCH